MIRPSRTAARWFTLAVVALAVAGLLAIVLALSRIPALATVLRLDPELAGRGLAVHVNLATGVWFFAFIAGLSCLGTGADARRSRLAVGLATGGAIAFTLAALTGARVVLADYVPVIDHGMFLAGLAAFAAGVVLEVLRVRPAAPDAWPLQRDVAYGVHAAGRAFAIAMVTIVTALVCRDPSASRPASLQALFWGGGHVLQFAATAGMLAAWLLLAQLIVGTRALPWRLARALFGLLLLPTVLGPWLVVTHASPRAFTRMMELGIAPVVLVVITALAIAVRERRRGNGVHWPAQPIASVALAVSIAMTLLGFALGAAITDNTTLTPAHYHISIGAVTVSFMATLVVLLQRSGAPIRRPRLAIWQPLIYGGGQTVFALGLAIAGFWGHAARKQYGTGHAVAAPSEHLGWTIAAVGGLLAFVGGVAFVATVLGCWRGRGARAA